MGRIITIDPITRISGFLEITVEVDGNRIINAKSSGMLFRGFEKMLKGRSPLDAIYFTERICGICSTAHAYVSALALEDALGVRANENDSMLRDFIHGCEFIQNHLRHFYQFVLPDYVKGPNIPPLVPNDKGDYRLPEDINNKLAEHYLESLQYSRLAHEMLAVLGGKAPHNHGIFVGGVTVNFNGSDWIKLKSILSSIRDFVKNTMLPDVYTIAEYYPEYYKIGSGYGNLMSYGVFDNYLDKSLFYLKPQVFIEGKYKPLNPDNITENIEFSWYTAAAKQQPPTSPTVNEDVYKKDAYSWIKAPRYMGYAMEVGPLARMWLSGLYRRGISTMDRIIARVLEVDKIIEIMDGLLDKIQPQNTSQGKYLFTQNTRGRGLKDTTRGALGHWLAVNNQEIQNYEIITPSAWNLSSEDSSGIKGVVEHALLGIEIANLDNPVEIGRVVRSYDPCVSCATHITGNGFSPIDIRLV